jgi:predicted RNA-binding protein
MAKPNFTLLKQINDLLKEVSKLEQKVADLRDQKEKVSKQYERDTSSHRTRLEDEHRQRLTLEKIEEEIQEIWSLEQTLRKHLTKQVGDNVKDYFSGDAIKDYLKAFLKQLDEDKQKYTIISSKNNAKLLPKGEKVEEVMEDILRIQVEAKEYIFDPAALQAKVADLLIKQEVPAAASA